MLVTLCLQHIGLVQFVSYHIWVIGNNKLSLSFSSSEYNSIKLDNPIPTIINGNLTTIKSYFTDKVFLEDFSTRTGVSLENLVSGTYKIIIEPVGYLKINGTYYACTATELAMFDNLLSGTN